MIIWVPNYVRNLVVHASLPQARPEMMDELQVIANNEVQEFLFTHEADDVEKFLLSGKTIPGLSNRLVAQQLQGRSKAKSRFPLYWRTRGVVYPPTVNLEQSSSQATAQFKSTLIRGTKGADLTMGFGVDTFFMSSKAIMTGTEPDESLLHMAIHNHQLLGVSTINYQSVTAEEFLKTTNEQFDFIYVDPSRRKESKKVFRFSDCTPEITSLVPAMLEKAPQVIIKASPFLDIKMGINELKHVSHVWVVAVRNECKEVLFVLSRQPKPTPVIEAVDLNTDGKIKSSIRFTFDQELAAEVSFHTPLKYLYEPNAAALKAGAFKWIASHYQLAKLSPDSHLYTSDELRSDFPGKCFEIVTHAHLDETLPSQFPGGYANIITRNYPLSVEEIKKRTGLKEGGELYLLCSRAGRDKVVVIVKLIDVARSGTG